MIKDETCHCGAKIRYVMLGGVPVPVEARPEPYWAPVVPHGALLETPGREPVMIHPRSGENHVLVRIKLPHWPRCKFYKKWVEKGCPPILEDPTQ